MTPSKVLQAVLGAIVALGFFGVFYIVSVAAIPDANRDTFTMLAGALVGAFSTVIGFAFGSSVGSQRKDETVYVRKDRT
jgi:hypothetical protein